MDQELLAKLEKFLAMISPWGIIAPYSQMANCTKHLLAKLENLVANGDKKTATFQTLAFEPMRVNQLIISMQPKLAATPSLLGSLLDSFEPNEL
jgi:hypothetical protein